MGPARFIAKISNKIPRVDLLHRCHDSRSETQKFRIFPRYWKTIHRNTVWPVALFEFRSQNSNSFFFIFIFGERSRTRTLFEHERFCPRVEKRRTKFLRSRSRFQENNEFKFLYFIPSPSPFKQEWTNERIFVRYFTRGCTQQRIFWRFSREDHCTKEKLTLELSNWLKLL